MKNLEKNKDLNESKQSYVKPTVEVYEIEVEGVILQSSEGDRTQDFNPSDDQNW